MNRRMVIGGVVVLLCFLMVVVFVMMRSGKDETPTTETPTTEPSTQAKTGALPPPPPPPPPKYEIYPDHDFTGGDISCQGSVEAAACEAKCDADNKCVSYIHTANDKLCCIKHGTPNYKELPGRQITGYIKNVDGYEVKEVGDRPAGDIESKSSATIPQCKARCDELTNCIGFNFNNGTCYIKKAEGISPTYSNNGFQFYTKKLT